MSFNKSWDCATTALLFIVSKNTKNTQKKRNPTLIDKEPRTGQLKVKKKILAQSGGQTLEIGVSQGRAPSAALRKDPPGLPSSWRGSHPRGPGAAAGPVRLCPRVAWPSPLCLFLASTLPGSGPTLIQGDLICTNHVCRDPGSKYGRFPPGSGGLCPAGTGGIGVRADAAPSWDP